MYGRLLLVTWTLAACNRVLGLDVTAELPDVDGSVADALPANCRVTSPLETHAATYLIDATPRGKDTEILTDVGQPGLFTYGIDGIQPDEYIAAAVLFVTPVTKCGITACTPCVMSATTYELYWNLEDWTEVDATSTRSDRNSLWSQPFAQGPVDRSARLASAPLRSGPQFALVATMADVVRVPATPWISTRAAIPLIRISLQLLTDGPAAFASDDHDDSTCSEAAAPPSLVLTICR